MHGGGGGDSTEYFTLNFTYLGYISARRMKSSSGVVNECILCFRWGGLLSGVGGGWSYNILATHNSAIDTAQSALPHYFHFRSFALVGLVGCGLGLSSNNP